MSGHSEFHWRLTRIHIEHFGIGWLQSAYNCIEHFTGHTDIKSVPSVLPM